jgi:tetratricopeptide (TPR) repeat protein
MEMKHVIRLMLAVLLIASPQLSFSDDTKTSIVQGWESIEQNHLDEALAQFEKALEQDPGNVEAMLGKARCLLYSDRLAEAEQVYTTVLQKDTDNEAAQLGLARAYNWQGKYDLALPEYERYLKRSPNHLEAQQELAKIYTWQGKLPNAQKQYERILTEDPRNSDALTGLEEIKDVLDPSQKVFIDYLTETDAGGFKSHTTAYGYRLYKPLGGGNSLYGEYRLEDYRETGKEHAIGNAVLVGGHWETDTPFDFNGDIDLREYSQDTGFFAGGMVNAVWSYYERNHLTLQYEHDLFDVLDDVEANRFSAELNNYLLPKLLLTNYYQFADLSDDNDSLHWQHTVTYEILKKPLDLSTSIGYRHRNFEDRSAQYYSPEDLNSVVYSVYAGKNMAQTYTYAQVKYFDNSDQIDSMSYLVGTDYALKKDVSVSAEMSYFHTTDKYHALGVSLAFHWRF